MTRISISAYSVSKQFILKGDPIMNKDQVKGTAKDIAGKVQEKAGDLTGDKEQKAKGLGKQVEGKTQKKVGDAKEAVKDSIDKL
jgi:uncharacterized protein YjbJ (UPF0337 family)